MEYKLIKGVLDGGPILVALVFMFMMWIKNKKNVVTHAEIQKDLLKMFTVVNKVYVDTTWLKDVHNQKDSDGVYTWYVRKSLEESVAHLSDSIQSLTLFMRDMHTQSKQTAQVLEKLVDKINKQ